MGKTDEAAMASVPRKRPRLRGAKFVSWEKTSNRGQEECNPNCGHCGCGNVKFTGKVLFRIWGGGAGFNRWVQPGLPARERGWRLQVSKAIHICGHRRLNR